MWVNQAHSSGWSARRRLYGAAAMLLALPVLTGRAIASGPISRIGAALGSDVPFFLVGGTALGMGRERNSILLGISRRRRES